MTDRDSPFFIVGCSRSGTTLLRLILTGHSRLCIPSETVFLIPLVRSLPLDKPLDRSAALLAIDIMTGGARWHDLGLPTEEVRTQILGLKDPRLSEIIDMVFSTVARREHKVRWGEKTPLYIEIVPQLAAIFPDAKFIHLVRDGRDVAISFKDAGFHERWYHGEAYDWTIAVRLGRQYQNSAFANRFLQIKYEDLVVNLEMKTREICEFLGEEYEPPMLQWRGRIERSIPAREHRIHGALRRDPGTDDTARWKWSLTALETFAIEAFLGADLAHLGYERRFARPGWGPALWLGKQLLRCARPLLDRSWSLRVGRIL